jgi:hypothetical protein
MVFGKLKVYLTVRKFNMVVVNFLPAWNVTEMMVHLSVAGFISSYGQDHIPHHRIL